MDLVVQINAVAGNLYMATVGQVFLELLDVAAIVLKTS